MSGMKFNLKCAYCGKDFFAPDRRTRLCSKCAKLPASTLANKPRPATPVAQKRHPSLLAKQNELTPDLAERITQLWRERYADSALDRHVVIGQISDELWVNRGVVERHLHFLERPHHTVTPELKAQIIAQYRGYIERLERPPGGRRRTISHVTGVPYELVRKTVYQWLTGEFAKAPTPELSREQLFQIEKCYFAELQQQRFSLSELPAQIAAQLGFATPWQVTRWIDQLHDDEERFANRPAVTPELEARVIEAYRAYLAAPQPPEQGLHFTLAQQLGGLSQVQVYCALLHFRHQQRAAYPLR